MKISIFAVTVLASLSCFASLSKAALVIQYQFNGNGNDTSGNGNNGSFVGSSLTTDRFGNPNGALAVTTSTGFLSQNNIGITGNSNRTISLWVKASIEPNWPYGGLIGWGTSTSDHHASTVTYGNYTNFMAANANINFDSGNSGASVLTDPSSLVDLWHMVTLSYNSTEGVISFYLDGVNQSNNYTSMNLNAINTEDSPLYVNGGVGFGNGISGSIDDVSVYGSALSAGEVGNLFAVQSVPEPSSLLLGFTSVLGFAFRRKR